MVLLSSLEITQDYVEVRMAECGFLYFCVQIFLCSLAFITNFSMRSDILINRYVCFNWHSGDHHIERFK